MPFFQKFRLNAIIFLCFDFIPSLRSFVFYCYRFFDFIPYFKIVRLYTLFYRCIIKKCFKLSDTDDPDKNSISMVVVKFTLSVFRH